MPCAKTTATFAEDALDALSVSVALGEHASRFRLDIRERCASTNTLLLDLAEQGAPGRTVLACGEQSAGRGRRGRTWLSAGRGSLTFSLLWRFPATDFSPAGLSLAVGVALARALEALGLRGVALKWPNDVLLGDRKLAGVLIELAPDTRTLAAIIGIGLNLRLPADFPGDVAAAALAEALPELPARSQILARLLLELETVLASFEGAGFGAFRESWTARCAHLDAAVTLTGEAGGVEGVCRGVDDDGALLLETAAGIRRVVSGDVSLRRC